MRVRQTPQNVMTMKKTASKRPTVSAKRVAAASGDAVRAHYDFDYAKSKPNRFAGRFTEGAVVIVLDPDVADVFQSAEAVNAFLRSAISAMPSVEPRKRKRAS